MRYTITHGTVQAYVAGFKTSPSIHHFGRPQYDRAIPILTDSLRDQAQPIVDMLNAGTISEATARSMLDKIWYSV